MVVPNQYVSRVIYLNSQNKNKDVKRKAGNFSLLVCGIKSVNVFMFFVFINIRYVYLHCILYFVVFTFMFPNMCICQK